MLLSPGNNVLGGVLKDQPTVNIWDFAAEKHYNDELCCVGIRFRKQTIGKENIFFIFQAKMPNII